MPPATTRCSSPHQHPYKHRKRNRWRSQRLRRSQQGMRSAGFVPVRKSGNFVKPQKKVEYWLWLFPICGKKLKDIKGLNYPSKVEYWYGLVIFLSFHNHQTTTLHFQRHWEGGSIHRLPPENGVRSWVTGCWKRLVRKVRKWPKILTDNQETQNLHELTHPKNDIDHESHRILEESSYLGFTATSRWHPLRGTTRPPLFASHPSAWRKSWQPPRKDRFREEHMD